MKQNFDKKYPERLTHFSRFDFITSESSISSHRKLIRFAMTIPYDMDHIIRFPNDMVKFTYMIQSYIITVSPALSLDSVGLSQSNGLEYPSKLQTERTVRLRTRTGKLETERTKGLTETSLIANRSALKPFPLIKFSNCPIYSD